MFVNRLSLMILFIACVTISNNIHVCLSTVCLPHQLACPMKAGPKVIVVTTGSPALSCTQWVLSDYLLSK